MSLQLCVFYSVIFTFVNLNNGKHELFFSVYKNSTCILSQIPLEEQKGENKNDLESWYHLETALALVT